MKYIGIRSKDSTLHRKLLYIAKYEGRSVNAHVLYLVRKNIEQFESKNGVILESDIEEMKGKA